MLRIVLVITLCVVGSASSAMAESCQTLWKQRNAIYRDAGYCFKTSRAIDAFGNAGCKYDVIGEVPLSDNDRQAVQSISRQESAQRCDNADIPARSIESRCRVTDPSNTPLNVRTSPYGRILRSIENGILVSVLDRTLDREGKSWVYVGSYSDNEPIGWVYREYISCF